jgi:hypothetical protein
MLGLLVGWRPLLAPIALFLLNRKSLLRDLFGVSSVAVLTNSVALMWMGGSAVLFDWLSEALPNNLLQYQFHELNMSVMGAFVPTGWSTAVFGAVSLAAAGLTRVVPRSRWLLVGGVVILLASPLVWASYWVTVTPLLVLGMIGVPFAPIIATLLLLSSAVAGLATSAAQIAVVLASAMALVSVVVWKRGDSANPAQTARNEKLGSDR